MSAPAFFRPGEYHDTMWFREYITPTKEGSRPYVAHALALMLNAMLQCIPNPGQLPGIAARMGAVLRERYPLEAEDILFGATVFTLRILFDGEPSCEIELPDKGELEAAPNSLGVLLFTGKMTRHPPIDISTGLYICLRSRLLGREKEVFENPQVKKLHGDQMLALARRFSVDMSDYAAPGDTVH